MTIEQAVRKRIEELVKELQKSLTSLCLDSGITPSTIFDFMVGKSKCPKVSTLKKFCQGAGITLKEFFDRSYFDDDEDFD